MTMSHDKKQMNLVTKEERDNIKAKKTESLGEREVKSEGDHEK